MFNSKNPTAFWVSEFKWFSSADAEVCEKQVKEIGQLCIGIQDTFTDTDTFRTRSHNITTKLSDEVKDKLLIIVIPKVDYLISGQSVLGATELESTTAIA